MVFSSCRISPGRLMYPWDGAAGRVLDILPGIRSRAVPGRRRPSIPTPAPDGPPGRGWGRPTRAGATFTYHRTGPVGTPARSVVLLIERIVGGRAPDPDLPPAGAAPPGVDGRV